MKNRYMRAGVVMACMMALPVHCMEDASRKRLQLTGKVFISVLKPIPCSQFLKSKFNGCSPEDVLGIDLKPNDFLVKISVSGNGSKEWFKSMPRKREKRFPNWLPLRVLIQVQKHGSLCFENVHGYCDVTLKGGVYKSRPDKSFAKRLASRMALLIQERMLPGQEALSDEYSDDDDYDDGWQLVTKKCGRR